LVEAAALAVVTSRARLGHLVLCAAYRNAALTAKAISTLDVVSGGRVVLGIGAGWKQDEWLAYGYGFPEAPTRLAILRDHLEIITRMLGPGRATYEGRHAHVRDAIHEPKGLQPRIPIVVGGNGPKVTWRLAARFADELCLDALPPDAVAKALPVIRARCEEIDRDPAGLRVAVHLWGEPAAVAPGPARQERLGEYADLGVDRVVVQGFSAVRRPDHLDALVEDCAAVGLLEPEPAR
jgi:alkanesulfonate monooxygenase SsuD/methylene tetrahydromethanopterin reductase-like flavin-dependent oxidoreductase (luciferase family)